jgi:ADP-ribosyl-[dinitrogen reductase] hydrolase
MTGEIILMNRTRASLGQAEKQRAMGVVVGAAVGDALGAPWEFRPAGEYRKRFPQRVLGGTGEMIGGGTFDWAPGEFTDDTQMAMALAESMLPLHGFEPSITWTWFRAWRRTARDIGGNTSWALSHERWPDVPDTRHGSTNGALMRCFPLALAYLDAPSDVVKQVCHLHAHLTHRAPTAKWGSWLAVEMIRVAVLGDDPLEALTWLLPQLPDDVRAIYAEALDRSWQPHGSARSNSDAVECLAQAVWCLRTTDTFEDAVVAAVSLGDDADTVACVTGALAGARDGLQCIPSRWATYVHGHIGSPNGPIDYRLADLTALALALVGVGSRPDAALEPAAGPVEVAPRLHAADLGGASTAPLDWAVVSLTRVDTRFADHPVRRQVFMIDDSSSHNPSLGVAVDDAVDAVDAFLAEGRTVVVHCHGGRSRTGLVLKAWKMRRDGCTEREAHRWLVDTWHRYSDYNDDFVDHLVAREVTVS